MSIKGNCVKIISAVAIALLLISGTAFCGITYPAKKPSGTSAQRPSATTQAAQDYEAGSSDDNLDSIGSLLERLRISGPVSDEFTSLYQSNQTEIDRILNENPLVTWHTFDLLLTSWPVLNSVEQNGGRLYLDREIFLSAMNLFEEFERVASPKLAGDLRKTKAMVNGRAKNVDTAKVEVDLN